MGTDIQPRDDSELVLSPELAAQFAQMASMIPEERENGSGYESILSAILAAGTLDDLDAPWTSTKAEKLAGKVLRLESPIRRPSDFRSGLRIFLAVPYTDTHTGETGVLTTGSAAVVGQLVRAYALGGFPCLAELVIAERPTADGYHPHHLKFYGSGDSV